MTRCSQNALAFLFLVPQNGSHDVIISVNFLKTEKHTLRYSAFTFVAHKGSAVLYVIYSFVYSCVKTKDSVIILLILEERAKCCRGLIVLILWYKSGPIMEIKN